jgi:hypothetical protein
VQFHLDYAKEALFTPGQLAAWFAPKWRFHGLWLRRSEPASDPAMADVCKWHKATMPDVSQVGYGGDQRLVGLSAEQTLTLSAANARFEPLATTTLL